jgi:hypothetical protein
MEMVRNQCPGKTGRMRLHDDGFQAFEELVTIMVVIEDIAATDSASDNMVQRTRCIYSRLAWHGLRTSNLWGYGKFKC